MKDVLLFRGTDEDAAAFNALPSDEQRTLQLTANRAGQSLLRRRLRGRAC